MFKVHISSHLQYTKLISYHYRLSRTFPHHLS